MARVPSGAGTRFPRVVVLFGATSDLMFPSRQGGRTQGGGGCGSRIIMEGPSGMDQAGD